MALLALGPLAHRGEPRPKVAGKACVHRAHDHPVATQLSTRERERARMKRGERGGGGRIVKIRCMCVYRHIACCIREETARNQRCRTVGTDWRAAHAPERERLLRVQGKGVGRCGLQYHDHPQVTHMHWRCRAHERRVDMGSSESPACLSCACGVLRSRHSKVCMRVYVTLQVCVFATQRVAAPLSTN
jgi:hypothetical protein